MEVNYGIHEDQSSLLRSIGGESRNEPEFYNPDGNITPGDAFFMCSDGAWEYLKDGEILIDYCKAADARMWAELLLLRIIDRVPGNHDNLSIITVMVN